MDRTAVFIGVPFVFSRHIVAARSPQYCRRTADIFGRFIYIGATSRWELLKQPWIRGERRVSGVDLASEIVSHYRASSYATAYPNIRTVVINT